jgi:hypothetical protein
MVQKYFIIITTLTACGLDAGRETCEVSIMEIQTTEQLRYGIQQNNALFDEIYPVTIENHKEPLKKLHEQELKILPSIPNRKDIFVLLNELIIGFFATHEDIAHPERVIINKAYLGKTPERNLLVNQIMMQFLKQTYPDALTAWTILPNAQQLPIPFEFKPSDYMYTENGLYDSRYLTAWERNLDEQLGIF